MNVEPVMQARSRERCPPCRQHHHQRPHLKESKRLSEGARDERHARTLDCLHGVHTDCSRSSLGENCEREDVVGVLLACLPNMMSKRNAKPETRGGKNGLRTGPLSHELKNESTHLREWRVTRKRLQRKRRVLKLFIRG